ncbi:MAG: protein-L-isoaspartate O-methyltransferase [Pseudomonadota bacterium]
MDFAEARAIMVDTQVRPNDVTDRRLLAALEQTQKELYTPSGSRALAYAEIETPLAPGRFVPTARDLSKLLQALKVKPSDLTLNIACGLGYTSAIMAKLCEMVVSTEADQAMAEEAERRLSENGVDNAAVIVAGAGEGAPSQGPYDVILIATGAEEIPEAILAQIKPGGRLGYFEVRRGVSDAVLISRAGDVFTKTYEFSASYRNVSPGLEAAKAFVF